MDEQSLKEELLKQIKEKAVIRGERKLASGKISQYYIDGKQVTLDPQGILAAAKVILHMVQTANADAVGARFDFRVISFKTVGCNLMRFCQRVDRESIAARHGRTGNRDSSGFFIADRCQASVERVIACAAQLYDRVLESC